MEYCKYFSFFIKFKLEIFHKQGRNLYKAIYNIHVYIYTYIKRQRETQN